MQQTVPSPQAVVQVLLDSYPRSFAQMLGLDDLARGEAGTVFRLLCASLLFTDRIAPEAADCAFRKLAERGWASPVNLHKSTLDERRVALEQADYTVFDQNITAAERLGELARDIVERFNGDVNGIRGAADRDVNREYRLIQELPGIGERGADTFFREVQVAWGEVFPFLDSRAWNGARRLSLDLDPRVLAELSGRDDFPRLVAALQEVEALGNPLDVIAKARDLASVK